MKIGIPKEVFPGEKRVAATPESIEKISKLGFSFIIETGAGALADFADDVYREAGAEVVDNPKAVWEGADIIMKMNAPMYHPVLGCSEVELLSAGKTLISFIWPAQNPELMQELAKSKSTVLAMDSVPRTSRAQSMDALSSMANIAGYRAVIEAAHQFGRFFTGQVTAAGSVPPAKVFVIGAGVAGLAAIGAAKGLGAIVRSMDTRPEVKDQVKSMGGEFVTVNYQEDGSGTGGYAKVMSAGYLQAQAEVIARQAMEVDIIITTALIPGKPAPKLITAGMVESMKPGSVIVDLAAAQGGNCELTEHGKIVVKHGVSIIGYSDLPNRLSRQSSQLYSTNLLHLLKDLCPNKDGNINVDMDDEVIRGTTVIKDGEITWPPPPVALSATPPQQATTAAPVATKPAAAHGGHGQMEQMPVTTLIIISTVATILFALVNMFAPPEILAQVAKSIASIYILILAGFVGFEIIKRVTPTLHTPLMSATNAISGISLVGSLVAAGSTHTIGQILGTIAVTAATINVVGGFMITERMLKMFKKKVRK